MGLGDAAPGSTDHRMDAESVTHEWFSHIPQEHSVDLVLY